MAVIFNSCKKNKSTGANVKTKTFSVTTWSNDGTSWYANHANSDITSEIQSSGTVDLFFSSDGGSRWQALPFTLYNGSSANYFWFYNYSTGNVQVGWTFNGVGLGADPNTKYGTTCMFKVVCISAATRAKNPDLDWKNYNEVKKRFHLTD